MKINVPLPFDWAEDPAFLTMDAVAQVGAAVERAGFDAVLVTDHPCPTKRWLDSGGHEAHDAFVTLAMLGAVTRKVRLQTGILVLPYRNPFIVARAVATLDRFSGGRVSLSLGAGYLRSEYRALGVDFERRNEIMDEYLRALKASLTGEEFSFEGSGYVASGAQIAPGPLQTPHPPLIVGGNSRRAIRRAVELADGWNPFFTGALPTTSVTRTAAMSGEDDIVGALDYMRAHCQATGRETPPEVILASVNSGDTMTTAQIVDSLGRYAELGIAGAAVYVGGRTTAEWCDNAERVGAEVVAKVK